LEARGPGCQCCVQRKAGCSLVGIKWRVEKKEGKRRLVSERREENSAAPMMELSDGFMEQVEAIAKELRNISGGIWALVEGIGRLTEVVEGVGKEGVRKEEMEMEMEMDKGWTSRRRQKGGRRTVKKRRRVRKKKKKIAGRKTEIRRWRRWRRSK
jgi:hypothetical protein